MLFRFEWVLRIWLEDLLVFAWVLRGTTSKTNANSSIRMCKLLKPMQIALGYSESMASPCWSMSVSCELVYVCQL